MKNTPIQPGEYFDSHAGIYIGKYVIQLAMEHGYHPDCIIEGMMDPDEQLENITDHEFYLEYWEEAEDYLNENVKYPFHTWCSTEHGDFGLYHELTMREPEDVYIEFCNDYLTIEKMAEHYQIEEETLKDILEIGKS